MCIKMYQGWMKHSSLMSFNKEQKNVVGDTTVNPLEVNIEIMRKIQK